MSVWLRSPVAHIAPPRARRSLDDKIWASAWQAVNGSSVESAAVETMQRALKASLAALQRLGPRPDGYDAEALVTAATQSVALFGGLALQAGLAQMRQLQAVLKLARAPKVSRPVTGAPQDDPALTIQAQLHDCARKFSALPQSLQQWVDDVFYVRARSRSRLLAPLPVPHRVWPARIWGLPAREPYVVAHQPSVMWGSVTPVARVCRAAGHGARRRRRPRQRGAPHDLCPHRRRDRGRGARRERGGHTLGADAAEDRALIAQWGFMRLLHVQ